MIVMIFAVHAKESQSKKVVSAFKNRGIISDQTIPQLYCLR